MQIRLNIERDMSKEEEIAVLEKIAVSFSRTDNYLTQLFRPAFVQWVENKIRGDIFPDAIEHITEYQSVVHDYERVMNQRDNAIDKASELEAQLNVANEMLNRFSTDNMALKTALDIAQQENKKLRESADHLSEVNGKLHENGMRICEEKNGFETALNTTREELKEAELEILKLKARMFEILEERKEDVNNG